MEALLILLALAVPGLVLLLPIISIVTSRSTRAEGRELAKRVAELETQVAGLRAGPEPGGRDLGLAPRREAPAVVAAAGARLEPGVREGVEAREADVPDTATAPDELAGAGRGSQSAEPEESIGGGEPDEAPELVDSGGAVESVDTAEASVPTDTDEIEDTPPPRGAPAAWTPLSASAPPPEPPRDAAPPPEPRDVEPRKPAFDLERWIGVRGAAVLGGGILALAGLLLFKYSVEAGFISPTVRVALGAAAGFGCIVAAQTRWLRQFGITANAVAGAGCAALYAAFWAAGSLYGLVPGAAAFGLMAAVTVACCALSLRHDSLMIALLGLIGGFLAPLLVDTGVANPVGRFGYILLLDGGLLLLARRRGWTLLVGLSLAGTVAYEALWSVTEMGPDDVGLGLLILGVFAATFTAAAHAGKPRGAGWSAASSAALLLPAAFSLWFAMRTDFAPTLWATGGLLVLLNAAAGWLAMREDKPLLATGMVAASMPTIAAWLLSRGASVDEQMQAAVIALLIAATHHGLAEFASRRGASAAGAPVASLGGLLVVLLGLAAAPSSASPWLAEAAVALLAVAALRQAGLATAPRLALGAVLGLGAAQSLPVVQNSLDPAFPSFAAWLTLLLATAIGLQLLGRLWGRGVDRAAWVHPVLILGGWTLAGTLDELPVVELFAGSVALGLVAATGATRLASGSRLLIATIVAAAPAVVRFEDLAPEPGQQLPALLICFAAAALFTAWPLLTRAFATERTAWRSSAVAGPLWFLALLPIWRGLWGDGAIGVLPLLLAVLLVGALALQRTRGPDASLGTLPQAWAASAALGLVAAAVPLQLDHEWLTIGWALEGVAVLLLWKRLDHPGLKYFALALFAAVCARLLLNPYIFGYGDRGPWRIVNWIAYTYLVPAAALFAAGRVLSPLEVERARPRESSLYRSGVPVLAGVLGLAGLAVVFAWMNLAVVDWFTDGDRLSLDLSRQPARDLAFSLVWAMYAVFLLALGVLRSGRVLRWASLLLLLGTLAKVFLYDLGELDDLYRVASLVGLAGSLIGVSLVYQRFVFREREPS